MLLYLCITMKQKSITMKTMDLGPVMNFQIDFSLNLNKDMQGILVVAWLAWESERFEDAKKYVSQYEDLYQELLKDKVRYGNMKCMAGNEEMYEYYSELEWQAETRADSFERLQRRLSEVK